MMHRGTRRYAVFISGCENQCYYYTAFAVSGVSAQAKGEPAAIGGLFLSGRFRGEGLSSLMDKMIARLNIEHFRKQLASETNEATRRTLLQRLSDEEAKLAALRQSPKDPRRHSA